MLNSKIVQKVGVDSSSDLSILAFLISIFLGILAESFVIFSIPLIVLELTSSPSYAGLAFMLEWVPAIIMYPIAGAIADKLGPKGALALSSLTRFLIITIAIFCIYKVEEKTLFIVLTCAFALSFLLPFSRVGAEKNVALLKENKNISIIHSYVQSSELLAWTLGPALAAFSSEYLDLIQLLSISGIVFLFSFLSIMLYRVQPNFQSETNDSNFFFGITYIFERKPLFYLAALNSLINFMFAVVISSHAAIITGVFELSEKYYGILNFIGGMFGFVNLLLVPILVKRMSMFSFSVVGLLLLGFGFVVLSLSTGYVIYVVGFSMSMMGISLFNIFNRTLRTSIIEQQYIGKVMGVFYLINIIMLPLGGGVIYIFADLIGNQPIIILSSVTLIPVCFFLSFKANKGFALK
ncbi:MULTISPECIES: MFS transporter [Vibrio]|uniref:MFS transporter n=1 Tax=Vibrio TaxID=662 RepID=UPI000E0C882F|nr:MFS transporter [Vibrio tetraodonis]